MDLLEADAFACAAANSQERDKSKHQSLPVKAHPDKILDFATQTKRDPTKRHLLPALPPHLFLKIFPVEDIPLTAPRRHMT